MAKLTHREKAYLRTSLIDEKLYEITLKKLEGDDLSGSSGSAGDSFRDHWDPDYKAFLIET